MKLWRGLTVIFLLASASPLAGQIPIGEYAARRAALASRIGDGVVVAFGGREPVRHWPPFYQLPAFRYLTGFLESDAAFVLATRGEKVMSTLFLARPDARTALFNGERVTAEGVSQNLGLSARYADELPAFVDSLLATGLPLYSVADFQSNEYSTSDSLTAGRAFVRRVQARRPGLRAREINQLVDELRAKKSEAEVSLLRTAVEISSRAHEAAMRAIRPGIRENEIQAVMEAEYRKLGADSPGYSSIVGSGPNSTVLHYPAGTREAMSGEVVLMDVSAYYDGYTADITRTVSVDPTFSPEQRDVYEIVLEAQKAAEAEIRPGVYGRVPTAAANAVLWAGLERLGLIESADATFDPPPGCARAQTGRVRSGTSTSTTGSSTASDSMSMTPPTSATSLHTVTKQATYSRSSPVSMSVRTSSTDSPIRTGTVGSSHVPGTLPVDIGTSACVSRTTTSSRRGGLCVYRTRHARSRTSRLCARVRFRGRNWPGHLMEGRQLNMTRRLLHTSLYLRCPAARLPILWCFDEHHRLHYGSRSRTLHSLLSRSPYPTPSTVSRSGAASGPLRVRSDRRIRPRRSGTRSGIRVRSVAA